MVENVHVVVIPGLGNEIQKHTWASDRWRKSGIIPHVFDAKWKTEEKGFNQKLDEALELVDVLIAAGKKVSLIGNSAGSSLAINMLGERRDKIHRVVVNCGRVRTGDWPWFTFDQATASSPSFKESVLGSERVISKLSAVERKKIVTLRPIFDEVVPPFTVLIKGARNEIVPSVEHVLSIGLNMTIFDKRIINFILEGR